MYDGIGALGIAIRIRDQTGIVCSPPVSGSGYPMFVSKNGVFRNRKWPGTTITPAKKQDTRTYRPMCFLSPNKSSGKTAAMAGKKKHGGWTEVKGELFIPDENKTTTRGRWRDQKKKS